MLVAVVSVWGCKIQKPTIWMARFSAVCFVALTPLTGVVALLTEACGPGFSVTWAGNGSAGTMTFATAQDCLVPSAEDIAGCLAGRRIHIVGDSTMRMPLQYFESSWLKCEPADSSVSRWVPGLDFGATRPSASAEGDQLCRALPAATRAKFVQLSHPLGRLALTYDTWK